MKSIQTDPRAAFEDKIKRGIFQPIERHVHEDIREERMQEALGLTWRLYAEHAERGEILDDALLVHACKLLAIDLSRYVAQCDGGQRKRDVFDLRNYLAGRVEVLRLDGLYEEEDEDGEGHRLENKQERPVTVGFAEVRCNNPVRKIHSAVDLVAWLAELSAEDQRMLELRAAGHTLEETADELGVSLTAVFHACRRLGLALAERAGIHVEPRKHQARGAEATSAATRRARRAGDTRARTRGGPRKTSPMQQPKAARCAA